MAPPAAPIDRIEALDILRGVAVCGILLINILLMSRGWVADAMLAAPPSGGEISMKLVVEGTMRGLFTLLFGAGMLLMTRRGRAAHVYIRRCIMLGAFGVVNVVLLLWPGDILCIYAIAGLAILPFRLANNRTLLTTAGILLLALSLADLAQALSLAPTTHPRPRPMDPLAYASYPALMLWSAKKWLWLNYGHAGAGAVVEAVAFMLIGMALFRGGVLAGERSRRFYATLAVVGYGLALPWRALIRWQEIGGDDGIGWLLFTRLSYEPSRLSATIGLLGLLLLLWKSDALGALARPLTALGHLALTNYLGQSLFTAILLYGFHLYGRLDFAQMMILVVGIWAVQAGLSLFWLDRFGTGPLERLLRAAAYGSWHDIRYRAATV